MRAEEARAIAGHPRSGFDQLMVIHDPRSPGTDGFMRIYNTDGSESGACGNGTRCVAYAMLDDPAMARPAENGRLTLETKAGLVEVKRVAHTSFTVDMGRPRLKWDEIPLAEPFPDTAADRAPDRPNRRARAAFAGRGEYGQPPRGVLRRARSRRLRSRPHRPDAREPPDLSRARQHLRGAGDGARHDQAPGLGARRRVDARLRHRRLRHPGGGLAPAHARAPRHREPARRRPRHRVARRRPRADDRPRGPRMGGFSCPPNSSRGWTEWRWRP